MVQRCQSRFAASSRQPLPRSATPSWFDLRLRIADMPHHSPHSLVGNLLNSERLPTINKSFAQLIADYEKAIEGIRPWFECLISDFETVQRAPAVPGYRDYFKARGRSDEMSQWEA